MPTSHHSSCSCGMLAVLPLLVCISYSRSYLGKLVGGCWLPVSFLQFLAAGCLSCVCYFCLKHTPHFQLCQLDFQLSSCSVIMHAVSATLQLQSTSLGASQCHLAQTSLFPEKITPSSVLTGPSRVHSRIYPLPELSMPQKFPAWLICIELVPGTQSRLALMALRFMELMGT